MSRNSRCAIVDVAGAPGHPSWECVPNPLVRGRQAGAKDAILACSVDYNNLVRDLLRDHEELELERRAEHAKFVDHEGYLVVSAKTGHRGVHLALLSNPAITDAVFDAIETEDLDVQLAMARHKGCSPEALDRLASSSSSPYVLRLVETHPRSTDVGKNWARDTLTDFLSSGGRQEPPDPHPEQVTSALLDPAPEAERLYMEYVEDAPNSHFEYRREFTAVMHPGVPTFILQRVLTKVLARLTQSRPVVDPDLLRHHVREDPLGTQEENLLGLAFFIAKHHVTTKQMLRDLSEVRDTRILGAMARHPNTALPNLKRLVRTGDAALLAAVASHPSRAVKELEGELLRTGHVPVTMAIAGNPFVRPSTLERLLNDSPSPQLAATLAANPALDEEFLTDLARHEDERVVAGVACNPSTPATVLRALASRDEGSVQLGVAINPAASPEALEAVYVVNHSDEIVQRVLGNPNTPRQVLDHACRWHDVFDGMARNPVLPEDLQTWLVARYELPLLRGLALNPASTAATLQAVRQRLRYLRLANEEEAAASKGGDTAEFPTLEQDVLHGLATHPNTPDELLNALADYHGSFVSLTARITQTTRN